MHCCCKGGGGGGGKECVREGGLTTDGVDGGVEVICGGRATGGGGLDEEVC